MSNVNRTRETWSYFEGLPMREYIPLSADLGLVPTLPEFLNIYNIYLEENESDLNSFFLEFKNETKTNVSSGSQPGTTRPRENQKKLSNPVQVYLTRINPLDLSSEQTPVFRFVFLVFLLYHWRASVIDKYAMLTHLIRFLPTLNPENATRFIIHCFKTHCNEELGSLWVSKLESLKEIKKEDTLLHIAYTVHSICTDKEKQIENLAAYLTGTIKKTLEETRVHSIPEVDRMAINGDIGALWVPTFRKKYQLAMEIFPDNELRLVNRVINSVLSILRKKIEVVYIGKEEGKKYTGGAFLRDFMQFFQNTIQKMENKNE